MSLRSLLLKISILSALAACVFMCTSCFALCTLGLGSGNKNQPTEYGMQFTLYEEGYVLSRVGTEMQEVEIPAEYEGLPVIGIGENAFAPYISYGCGGGVQAVNPIQVIIPESVKHIDRQAFYGNVIEEVIYDGTLEQWMSIDIEDSTPFTQNTRFFVEETKRITSVTVPESITYIKSYTFFGLGTLNSVTFHGGVEEIGAYSFSHTGIKKLEMPDSVTTVQRSAFYGCDKLVEATLSANLTNLPEKIFSDCYMLETVDLKCGIDSMEMYAFANCNSLTNIDLSFSTLRYIPEGAFWECSNLNVITIPESVIEIGSNAFSGCVHLFEVYNLSDIFMVVGSAAHGKVAFYAVAVYNDLSDDRAVIETLDGYYFSKVDGKNYLLRYSGSDVNLNLPASLNGENYVIRDNAFRGAGIESVNIPDAVTEIGEYAFFRCSALKTVSGASGVTAIGNGAFDTCISLVSDIPKNVVKVGDYAYRRCSSLPKVTIPCGVKYIPDCAFNDCLSLTSLTISEGVEIIGVEAFGGCRALKSITFPESLKEIRSYAFESAFSEAESQVNLIIPQNVEMVGNYAFRYGGVSSVEFKGAVSIGTDAFYSSQLLNKVIFNEGLKTIAYGAFAYCENLAELHFPSTITELNAGAFYNCVSLKSLSIDGNSPIYESKGNCIIEKSTKTVVMGCSGSLIPDDGSVKVIGEMAFRNCSFKKFTVPDSVTEIGEDAFFCCSLLETVYIGSGVKYFGYNILKNCHNLSDLYYNGTKAEFNAIEKDYGCFISYGQTITVHCKNSLPFKYTQN